MTLLDIEKAKCFQKLSNRISQAKVADSTSLLAHTDIRCSNWKEKLGYKSYEECVRENMGEDIGTSQIYKKAKAGATQYWLGGRSFVGKLSITATEELNKLKSDKHKLLVWKKASEISISPSSTLISEIASELFPNSKGRSNSHTTQSAEQSTEEQVAVLVQKIKMLFLKLEGSTQELLLEDLFESYEQQLGDASNSDINQTPTPK